MNDGVCDIFLSLFLQDDEDNFVNMRNGKTCSKLATVSRVGSWSHIAFW